MEHDLPGREQLDEIARGIATEDGELPDGAELDMLLDAAAGLTRYEAESAFSLSLVRHGRILPDAVWDLKCQTLKKSGLMQLYRGTRRLQQPGRPGVAQGVLQAGPAAAEPQQSAEAAPWRVAVVAAGLRQSRSSASAWARKPGGRC